MDIYSTVNKSEEMFFSFVYLTLTTGVQVGIIVFCPHQKNPLNQDAFLRTRAEKRGLKSESIKFKESTRGLDSTSNSFSKSETRESQILDSLVFL